MDHAARVADELRKHGLTAQLEDGGRGEFTVLVGGRVVAAKEGDNLPPAEQVLAAVKGAGQATAGAKG